MCSVGECLGTWIRRNFLRENSWSTSRLRMWRKLSGHDDLTLDQRDVCCFFLVSFHFNDFNDFTWWFHQILFFWMLIDWKQVFSHHQNVGKLHNETRLIQDCAPAFRGYLESHEVGPTLPIDFSVTKGSPPRMPVVTNEGLGWLGFPTKNGIILVVTGILGGGYSSNLSNKMVASGPVLAKSRVTYGDDVWAMNVPIFAQIKCSFRLINMPSSRWICISIFLVWYLWLFDINGNVSSTSKRFLTFDFVNVRPFPVAERWAELVLKEFALQGDEEKVRNSNGWQQEEAGWNLPHKQRSKQLAIENEKMHKFILKYYRHLFLLYLQKERNLLWALCWL